MTLGEKIHELRREYKMSQEHVAELVGVSRQAASKWETGQTVPNNDNLICLAEIFHVTFEELTNPDTKVGLVFDWRKEIDKVREKFKRFKCAVIALLVLFVVIFSAALYTRFNGYSDSIVLILVIISAVLIMSVFIPIVITVLRYVYTACKKRGVQQ